MAIYDLYGIRSASIDDARLLVEKLLALEFEEHESSYHRGPYFVFGQMGDENFEIKVNLDPDEDLPNEDDFPDQKILLYINNTSRSSALRDILTSDDALTLLRHEDLK